MDNTKKQIERGGAEARRIFIRVGMVLLACCLMVGVQDGKKAAAANTRGATAALQNHIISDETKVEVVPITEEHHHHLVLDNEYVRVFHVEVAPHAETRYHQHDMDYVFVTLGDSVVESVRVGEKPVKLELKDGDTRFTKGGFAHKAVNLSDKPFVNVTVELKKPAAGKVPPPNDCASGQICYDVSLGPSNGNLKVELTDTAKTGVMHGVLEVTPLAAGVGANTLFVALSPITLKRVTADTGPDKQMNTGEIAWITSRDHYKVVHSAVGAKFITMTFIEK